MGHKKGGKRERENGRKKDRKGKGTERKAVVSELWGQGVHCTPKFRTCTPCIPQVKDAAYVKILSKRRLKTKLKNKINVTHSTASFQDKLGMLVPDS